MAPYDADIESVQSPEEIGDRAVAGLRATLR